jgi:hypothetical protein
MIDKFCAHWTVLLTSVLYVAKGNHGHPAPEDCGEPPQGIHQACAWVIRGLDLCESVQHCRIHAHFPHPPYDVGQRDSHLGTGC